MLDMLRVRILNRWYKFKQRNRDPEEEARIMKQHAEELDRKIQKILEEHEEIQKVRDNELL